MFEPVTNIPFLSAVMEFGTGFATRDDMNRESSASFSKQMWARNNLRLPDRKQWTAGHQVRL